MVPEGGPGTRERLLAVADEALAEVGPTQLSLREVARRAGVSHGAPLRHFSSLASLLASLAADGFRDLTTSISAELAAVDGTDAPAELLGAAMRGYLDLARRRPAVLALMFRPDAIDTADAAFAAESSAAFGQLLLVVRAAQSLGWHRDADGTMLAGAVWATAHGLALLWAQGSLPRVTANADLRRQLDVAIDVLVPAVPDRPIPATPRSTR